MAKLVKPAKRQAPSDQEKVQDSLLHKSVYIGDRKRKLPAWLPPLGLTMITLLIILWLLPRLFADPGTEPAETPVPSQTTLQDQDAALAPPLFQRGDQALIRVGECPLFDQAQLKARRISSALFGEQVEVIALENKWARVRLADGLEAWLDSQNLTKDKEMWEKQEKDRKAMVLAPYKRIMSHAIDGYTLLRAPMGTLLYPDHQAGEVLSLPLPDGQTGWVNKNDLLFLTSGDLPPVPAKANALFVSSAMNFYQATYIPGGMSKDGADMAGAIYIAARVNGLALPRDLDAQAQAGTKVETIKDVTSGLIRPQLLEPGDVAFFHAPDNPHQITQAAILLEEGQALCRLDNDSTLNIRDLSRQEELLSRLVTVRRYFAD